MAGRVSVDSRIAAVLVVVVLSLLGVIGDYFLKLASGEERFIWNRWFPIGLAIYASTAFGWVYALKHMKLATIGVVYSMCMILLLAALGIAVFKERLTVGEVVGIVMAVGSLILLSRFAG
jgi:small multidrug resistance pump